MGSLQKTIITVHSSGLFVRVGFPSQGLQRLIEQIEHVQLFIKSIKRERQNHRASKSPRVKLAQGGVAAQNWINFRKSDKRGGVIFNPKSLEIMCSACISYVSYGPRTSLHIFDHIHYKKIATQFSKNEWEGLILFQFFPKIHPIWQRHPSLRDQTSGEIERFSSSSSHPQPPLRIFFLRENIGGSRAPLNRKNPLSSILRVPLGDSSKKIGYFTVRLTIGGRRGGGQPWPYSKHI